MRPPVHSPLPMPYGPMNGDPGREGTGLGIAYTAVAHTVPASTGSAPPPAPPRRPEPDPS